MFKKEYRIISWIKKHTLLSIGIVVLLGGIAVFAKQSDADIVSEQAGAAKPVSLISLSEIQENQVVAVASGEVESLEQVTLSSEVFGTVSRVYVGIGDTVKAGQLLVQFKANDRAAQYTQTQADYENALASKTSLLAQIDAAYANHDKLKINAQSSITSAEAALRTAENNLQHIVDTGSNVIVDDAYADLVETLRGVENTTVDLLVVADSILGIDNQFSNDSYEDVLGVLRPGSFANAEQQYQLAQQAKISFGIEMNTISSAQSQAVIDTASQIGKSILSNYATLFSSLTTVLDNTPPIGGLTQTTLTSLITSVNAGRTEVTTQQSALTNAVQAISTAKQSFTSQQIAYDTAVQNLSDAKAKATADIAASEAGLKQLEATLASQDANIKRARGAMAGVSAELAKAAVRSPISGKIANIAVKQGEIVSNGVVVADVVNTKGLQVAAYVLAEALLSLSVGGDVLVEGKPVGHILRIAPSINTNTKKVEVVVSIDDTEESQFVVGQFVNIQMLATAEETASAALLVPLSAVKITAQSHSVFVVEDGHTVSVSIETGNLIGDKIEILSGIDGYDAIVSSVRGIEEGDAVSILE